VTGNNEGGFFIMIARKPLRTGNQAAPNASNGDGLTHEAGSYAVSRA